ncbi:MAG TPA: hypothetical protein VF173_30395 [Thermoanaerobaculia bacterium]|nr:hypothetical protein [Thermoanaerobaculia bacterium]
MKKMLVGLSLSLAALGFLLSPAMAVASPPQAAPVLSVADQAFLASLAAPLGTPAPVDAAKRPHIGPKSLCNATANCWNGGTVTCSGNNSVTSCSAADGNCGVGEPGHVTCDGVTTPCAPCPIDCDALAQQCADNCSPCAVKSFQCNPYRCRCLFNTNCI